MAGNKVYILSLLWAHRGAGSRRGKEQLNKITIWKDFIVHHCNMHISSFSSNSGAGLLWGEGFGIHPLTYRTPPGT